MPPLDLPKLKTRVITYLGALQTQLTQTGQDNLRITSEFREQGIEQDITCVLKKIHDYLREVQQRITQYASGVRQRGNLSEAYIRQFLEQKTMINACFATLAEKPHLTPG